MNAGTRLGSYEIVGPLGSGGMASVFLARDLRHDRCVALKVVREQLAATLGHDRFLQEIRTTARLQHPHILPLLDSGEIDGRLFYVMPYVEGETLRARLDRERTLPLSDVVQLTKQIASALEAAHRRGVIHRDIKPENILLTDGLPLLADFGIALAVEQAASERLTSTGASIGTPAYMSPEQVLGTGPVDARSDLYSLACLVFEAVAGHPPFQGTSSFAIVNAHVNASVPRLLSPLEDVPASFSDAVGRALAKAPAGRFPTVSEFASALAATVETRRATGAECREATRDGKTIVVLPFDNLSPDPGDAYLADGLTEEVTADLARIRALRVIARNSAGAAKARTRDVREIARLLETQYVLEGSVRRAGSALRITAQLIDGVTNAHVWSEKYSGTMDDVFAMQERIAREIVAALALQLSADEQRGLAAHTIKNLEAYQLYLQARTCLKSGEQAALARARDLLDRALAIEGENEVLLGIYGVLEMYDYSMGFNVSPATLRRGDDYATRALACNPRSAQGLHAKAIVAEKTDLGVSLGYLRQSVAVDPIPEAMALLAIGLAVRGEELEAMQFAHRAVPLDPLSPMVLAFAAAAAWESGAVDQAVGWVDAALRAVPDNPAVQYFAGYIHAAMGQHDRGLALLDGAIESAGDTYFQVLPALFTQALRNQPLPAVPESFQPVISTDPHGSQFMAEIYAAAGRHDEAVSWLENAVRLGVANARYMTEQSPFLRALRGTAAFERVIAEARARVPQTPRRSVSS